MSSLSFTYKDGRTRILSHLEKNNIVKVIKMKYLLNKKSIVFTMLVILIMPIIIMSSPILKKDT